jgi:hypothetical protein
LFCTVACLVVLFLAQAIIEAGDHAVPRVYDKVMGGRSPQIGQVDLGSLAQGMVSAELEFHAIELPGYQAKGVTPLKNWTTAHAKEGEVFPITKVLPLDEWIPIGKVGEALNVAVHRVVEKTELPDFVKEKVQEAVNMITGPAQLSVPNAAEVLGAMTPG